MKKYLVLILSFYVLNLHSQKIDISSKTIQFDFTYQSPITGMSIDYGNNSAIGLSYLTNKNDLLFGLDANFMFGNNVKNDSILRLIGVDNLLLINANGELDEVLLYERGANAHLLFGKSFRFEEKHLSGIYVYGGLGYLQYKTRLETNKTYLPQIDEEYIKGYDNFTNGISTKICVDFMHFDKKTSVNYHIGLEFLNAFTKNRRAYNFSNGTVIDNSLKIDQLIGLKFGIIIPIQRNNEEKFHYN